MNFPSQGLPTQSDFSSQAPRKSEQERYWYVCRECGADETAHNQAQADLQDRLCHRCA
jgi:hypothetical protein